MIISRRQFLRLAAAGGAGIVLTSCRTAGPARSKPFRIVFFTDVHTRTEWETPEALRLAASAINEQKPDLVIGGGDYVTEGFESSSAKMAPRWEAYFENFHRRIEAPVEPAIGNHDLIAALPEDGTPPSTDPRAEFRQKFGVASTYRSFDAGGCHFVLLDSIEVTGGELKYRGFIGPAQRAWLREDLAMVGRGTPVVAVTHLPLVTDFYRQEGKEDPPNRVVVNRREVLDAFRGHDLLLVLQGHLHVEERLRRHGVEYITGGAICGQWWRGPWRGTPEGFGVVSLTARGVEWEYVPYGWTARRPVDA